MEFRFRAGDSGPPSSASLPSSETCFASSSTSCHGHFSARAMRGRGAPPPLPVPPFDREAARREWIREEVERQLIEEEVRLEVKAKVELALARRLHGGFAHDPFMPPMHMFPHSGFPHDPFMPPMHVLPHSVFTHDPFMPPMHMFPHVPPPPLLDEFGVWEEFRRFGPRGPAGFGSGFGFRKRLLPEEEEKWSPPRPPLPNHKLELREIEPSESSEVPPSEAKVAGMKRKADLIAATTATTKVQKPAQHWSCALCQVSATSEAGLNEHLQGKKHQAMLAELGAVKLTNNEKSTLEATSGNKDGNNPGNAPKKICIQVDGATHEVVQRSNYLWCERCRIRCDNSVTMAGHLRGKKHRELHKVWTSIRAVRMNNKIKKEGIDVATNVAPLVQKQE